MSNEPKIFACQLKEVNGKYGLFYSGRLGMLDVTLAPSKTQGKWNLTFKQAQRQQQQQGYQQQGQQYGNGHQPQGYQQPPQQQGPSAPPQPDYNQPQEMPDEPLPF